MITDPPAPEPAGTSRRWSGLRPGDRRPGRGAPGWASTSRTLSIGGRIVRVAVREGNPDWPPLLLCNGIGASLELFQPFVDALDPQRAVIRFDMPGIGGSPAPVVPYHLVTLPSLLSGLLDQLGYEQADVLGISWGGGLAQQFAASRPARVRRLVLVATGPGALMVPGHPRVLLRMLTPRRHRDPGHAARIAGELYGGSVRDDPALARDLLHATTTRLGPSTGYYYQLLSSIAWTSLPRLPRLRPPTLILAGDDDPIIPLINARIMHRLIPRSELHIYHGGHLELATDAERMAPIVEAFLGPEGADDVTGGSASSSPTSNGNTSSPSGGSSTRRSCRSSARTGNGPRSAGRWLSGCPSSASSARTSRATGAGMSPMACGLVTMELHRGDGSLGVFLGVHAGLAMLSIAMCGSEEQKARWVPDLAQMNKLGAFALTEPRNASCNSVALEPGGTATAGC